MCCAVIVGGFWLGVDQESVAGNECVTSLRYLIISNLLSGSLNEECIMGIM
jgi:hypothetical protein